MRALTLDELVDQAIYYFADARKKPTKVTHLYLRPLVMCQIIQNSDAAQLASARACADGYSTEHSKARP